MRPLAFLFLGLLGLPVSAADLPRMVAEASALELEGRLGDALELYRSALNTQDSLNDDEDLSSALTVRVLSKVAHLSIDLGQGEEAWDLGGRLLSASSLLANEAGTLIRLRILLAQGKTNEAKSLVGQYFKKWPKAPRSGALAWEGQTLVASSSTPVVTGPWLWVGRGDWEVFQGPSRVLGLTTQETVRLQVGAFQDWGKALTLLDSMREKGWVPFTDTKVLATGARLHIVYVVSRQPESDRARLESQGLTTLP